MHEVITKFADYVGEMRAELKVLLEAGSHNSWDYELRIEPAEPETEPWTFHCYVWKEKFNDEVMVYMAIDEHHGFTIEADPSLMYTVSIELINEKDRR